MAKPWASVRRICEAEHMAVLGEGSMYLFEKQARHMQYFRGRAVTMLLTSGFIQQGALRGNDDDKLA